MTGSLKIDRVYLTMAFQRVKPKKIYEEVAEQIEKMIREKEIKPGDKLASVQTLAEQFGVGRSAVREALSALRAKGLLEMRQGEGTFVRSYDRTVISHAILTAVLMNPKEIRDLLEVRKFLEVGSAGAAAERRSEEDLARMRAALSDMEEHLDDEAVGERADVQFHLAVTKASANGMLQHLMNTVVETMTANMRDSRRLWLYADSSSAKQLFKEHQAIYEAIRERNREQAEQLMFRHLDKVERTVWQFLVQKQNH